MTYKEYMMWTQDSKIDLSKLNVRINNPLLPEFEVGCYDNHDGTWTFYRILERSRHTEIVTENEAFDKLKVETISKVIEYEYNKRCIVQSELMDLLKKRNISNHLLELLSDIISLNVRYKMGYGFGLAKIENGEEIFVSPFYNEINDFIDYLLDMV